MNKTLLFLLLPGLLISCKPTPPSGDNGEIDPQTSECQLKNSELYIKYPNKIKLVDKENGGLSDARNYGIPHATREYIAFLDSDN